MSSGLRSQASNEGQGGGQNPLALQADFSQGIAIAVQEQVARAVSDVSTQLSTGLDKRIDQLDQRAEVVTSTEVLETSVASERHDLP